MRWVLRTLTGACVALALIGCSDSGPQKSTDTTVVPWADYEPGLQAKIDAMATAKDCQGLLIEFNQIGGTNLEVRTKFGHGNVELLNYIDAKERAVGCF